MNQNKSHRPVKRENPKPSEMYPESDIRKELIDKIAREHKLTKDPEWNYEIIIDGAPPPKNSHQSPSRPNQSRAINRLLPPEEIQEEFQEVLRKVHRPVQRKVDQEVPRAIKQEVPRAIKQEAPRAIKQEAPRASKETNLNTEGVILINSYDKFKAFKKWPKCIVMYTAEGCEACTSIKPLYHRIGRRYGQHIKLGIVDIDELNLDFSKVPVFVAYVKGEEVNNMLGSDPQGLKDFIKNTILLK